jgi:hypothetical protein
MENIWYVYQHIREDKNIPFYIGIGSMSNYRRAYITKDRSQFWKNITKISNYHVEIIMDNLSEEEAKSKEIEYIKLYGRRKNGGILCNLTDGGDGVSGYKHTDETKDIIKSKRKNQIFSVESRKIFSINNIGNTRALGKKHSEDKKIAKSLNQRGKFGGQIIRKDIDGNIIEFSGIKDAAESINVKHKDIWYAITKRSGFLYKGFYWEYKGERQIKNTTEISKEYLYQKYIIEKISGEKIGEELNCSGNKIYRLLKKYNLIHDIKI